MTDRDIANDISRYQRHSLIDVEYFRRFCWSLSRRTKYSLDRVWLLADVTSNDRLRRRSYPPVWEHCQHGCHRESNQVGEHSVPR